MILKQIPQDFIVEEIYNLKNFEEKQENRKQPYYYFKLTKTNYNQLNAIEKVARVFNTSKKLVHFAGTKDKVGITTQIISVYGINEENFEKNLEYFNQQEDLKLEFIAKYDGRINLGDNLGNSFKIMVRDLDEDDIKKVYKNLEKVKTKGVLNYFDDQRFGYAGNSHIVGKYVLKNEIENAVFEILTSNPQNPSDELKLFTDFIKTNWEGIKNQDPEVIANAQLIIPQFLRSEAQILTHLGKYRNDFPGAFRKIHKKLRTLYLNAFQSFVFNEIIKKLDKQKVLENYDELPLISADTKFDLVIKEIVDDLLKSHEISFDNFQIPHMPELKIYCDMRKTRIFPQDIEISESCTDDLNPSKSKVLISFNLGKGEYATNVIKQLFI